MQLMLADIDQIRAFVYGGGTQADADKAAASLVSWSQRMAELFPPGQASTDYVDMSAERVRGAPEAMKRTADYHCSQRCGQAIDPRLATGVPRTDRDGCGFRHLSATR
jgi:hypothetical protein